MADGGVFGSGLDIKVYRWLQTKYGQPAADQYFPICTTSNQIVTHAALVTHSQRYATGNNVLCYWELPRPMQLSNTSPGYYPCLVAAGLTIRLDD